MAYDEWVRDAIREAMAEKGNESLHAAARAMGIPNNRFTDFMSQRILQLGEKYGAPVAEYLGLTWEAFDRWMRRDVYQIHKERKAAKGDTVVAVEDEVMTWSGPVGERADGLRSGRSCDDCELRGTCRAEVMAGRPMPCEQLLVKDLITPDLVFRVGPGSPRVGTFEELADDRDLGCS